MTDARIGRERTKESIVSKPEIFLAGGMSLSGNMVVVFGSFFVFVYEDFLIGFS